MPRAKGKKQGGRNQKEKVAQSPVTTTSTAPPLDEHGRQIHRGVQNAFAPKPLKPEKKRTLYSGMVPPIPDPQLLDLVHNFLTDFRYVKAAHGMRTDNQKRPGHNMEEWKWQSTGMPDLLTLFHQWQVAHPGKTTSRKTLAEMRNETRAAQLAAAPKVLGQSNQTVSEDADLSDTSTDAEEESDEEMVDVETVPVPSLKRKAESPASDSSSDASDVSSESESGSESDSDSDSDGNSGSGSNTSSSESGSEEDEKESGPIAKKVKAGVAAADDSSDATSSSEDDSDAGVDVKSTAKGAASVDPASVPLPSDTGSSSSDSDSASSGSDSESDEESEADDAEKELERKAPTKAASSQPKKITNGVPIEKVKKAAATEDELSASSSDSDASESDSSSSSDSSKDEKTASKPPPQPLNGNKRKRVSDAAELTTDQKVANDATPTHNGTKLAKKTNTPFSRIPDTIAVDPRFASNQYVSYDYADRAHAKLSVVRGKGFTKEKNKGKRGSYRGGMIDTSAKGIKFED